MSTIIKVRPLLCVLYQCCLQDIAEYTSTIVGLQGSLQEAVGFLLLSKVGSDSVLEVTVDNDSGGHRGHLMYLIAQHS